MSLERRPEPVTRVNVGDTRVLLVGPGSPVSKVRARHADSSSVSGLSSSSCTDTRSSPPRTDLIKRRLPLDESKIAGILTSANSDTDTDETWPRGKRFFQTYSMHSSDYCLSRGQSHRGGSRSGWPTRRTRALRRYYSTGGPRAASEQDHGHEDQQRRAHDHLSAPYPRSVTAMTRKPDR